MAKITIFGLAGTGTSTVGKLCAKECNYEFLSSGDMFRVRAKELGLTLEAMQEKIKNDPEEDAKLDVAIEEYGKTHENFVIESRLAWHFIPDSFKVKLFCDENIRMKRVAARDSLSLEETKNRVLIREAGDKDRYKNFYKIENISDDAHYDLIIDSTKKLPEEIVNIIKKKISQI